MTMLAILLALLLLFGAGGYWGYRRHWYGGRGYGVVWLMLIIIVVVVLFGRSRWGWYS